MKGRSAASRRARDGDHCGFRIVAISRRVENRVRDHHCIDWPVGGQSPDDACTIRRAHGPRVQLRSTRSFLAVRGQARGLAILQAAAGILVVVVPFGGDHARARLGHDGGGRRLRGGRRPRSLRMGDHGGRPAGILIGSVVGIIIAFLAGLLPRGAGELFVSGRPCLSPSACATGSGRRARRATARRPWSRSRSPHCWGWACFPHLSAGAQS